MLGKEEKVDGVEEERKVEEGNEFKRVENGGSERHQVKEASHKEKDCEVYGMRVWEG